MKYYRSRSLAVILLVISTSSTNGLAVWKRDHSFLTPDRETAESHLLEVTNHAAITKDVKFPSSDGPNIVTFTPNLSKNINQETSEINNLKIKSIAIQEKPPEQIKLQGSAIFDKSVTETRSDDLMKNKNKTSTITTTTNLIINKLQNNDSYTTSPKIFSSRNHRSNTKYDTFNNIITSSITTEYMKRHINPSKTTQILVLQHIINSMDDDIKDGTVSRKNRDSDESLKEAGKNYDTLENSTEIDENFIVHRDSLQNLTESAPNTYDTSTTMSQLLTTVSPILDMYSMESKNTTESFPVSDQTNYEITHNDGIYTSTNTETYLSNEEQHTIMTELMQTINNDKTADQQAITNKINTKDGAHLTTVYDSDLKSAETVQISVEKIPDSTPASSTLPMDFKKDIKTGLEKSSSPFDFTITTSSNKSPNEKSYSSQANTNRKESQMAKLGIISSKRAGFIDNSETIRSKESTTQKYVDELSENHADNLGIMGKTRVSDIGEKVVNRNLIVKESQSHMTADAIQEELLIERMVRENELAKSRQELSQPDKVTTKDILNTTEIVTMDTLNVKPISSDKRKITTLYTPSSNYKPMKKLDVQPLKQFVRDPDDNSWRNESISSLGIVFKPKNASKSFTEVIKNKTTELSSAIGRYDKDEVPDLRLRLEKIAENRKSKKKTINKYGETASNEYEESSENNNVSKEDVTSPMIPFQEQNRSTTTTTTNTPMEPYQIVNSIQKEKKYFFKSDVTTSKGISNLADYYDGTDEYDDYLTFPEIEIKKFKITTPPPRKTFATSPFNWEYMPPPESKYHVDRQPTVQYFPPTKKVTVPAIKIDNQKRTENNNISNKNKANLNELSSSQKTTHAFSFNTVPSVPEKFQESAKQAAIPHYIMSHNSNKENSNSYVTDPTINLKLKDADINRATYLIKHYKDFIDEATKDTEDEKDYLPLTKPPVQGDTLTETDKFIKQKEEKLTGDYDYDSQFRKNILHRFVDNFNENSDRFKEDFPVIYNNSVVHTKAMENGKVMASSSAFMKRLYEMKGTKSIKCDVNCERMTVELSPAYELHYYVPDQEETEVIEPRLNPGPYKFTL